MGADWCGPCRVIKDDVYDFFNQSPENVICCDLNVDISREVYLFLKRKRMLNGIPVMLCYVKGNVSYIPDDSVTGSDKLGLHSFFYRCKQLLLDVQ